MSKTCVFGLAAVLLAPELRAADQSFLEPAVWATGDFTQNWDVREHPRLLADVDGDGRQDIVGFGFDGVWVGRSTGSSFEASFEIADFGYVSGWRVKTHERTIADVNGDGRPDIVAFGTHGVWTALNESTPGTPRFSWPIFALADFGFDQGWTAEKHVRVLADLNADTWHDVVGFGEHGVWTALSNGNGTFQAPVFAVGDFGYLQAWRVYRHTRRVADVSGDGAPDIVGFGDHGTWLALGTGAGAFAAPVFAVADFGYNQGWRVPEHVRTTADLDGDGRQDVVGFGSAGVWVARANGSGFDAPYFAVADTKDVDVAWGAAGTNPRFVADLNADGHPDVFGFGWFAVTRALGVPGGGLLTQRAVLRDLTSGQGYDYKPRLAGDVTGDGMADLVAFGSHEVKVAVSTDLPPPSPPKTPTDTVVKEVGAESITAGWKDNSDNERMFLVRYENMENDEVRRVTAAADATERKVTGLEPETRYCLSVRAENLWGVSANSREACDETKREEPPPPPPPQGWSRLFVFNCHSSERPVHVWTFDHTQSFWKEKGTVASMWNNGSCPASSQPFQVDLDDGHVFTLVAVDPSLGGCGVNDPSQQLCQRLISGPILGDADGPALIQTVN